MIATQKWKEKKKSLRKQNQSTNSTFSILQLSTPHPWFWLSWLKQSQSRLSQTIRRGEAHQVWWVPENWWSTAPKSLNKQPKVGKKKGTERWGGKWWGTGFKWELPYFPNPASGSSSIGPANTTGNQLFWLVGFPGISPTTSPLVPET